MALLKTIKQNDGVITSYHRVLYLQAMINSHISIAVVSDINEEGRRSDNGEGVRPYRSAITYEKDYQENMTIEEAYAYLKTLPEFEGAEDI